MRSELDQRRQELALAIQDKNDFEMICQDLNNKLQKSLKKENEQQNLIIKYKEKLGELDNTV